MKAQRMHSRRPGMLHAPRNPLSAGSPPPGARGRAPTASAPPAAGVRRVARPLGRQRWLCAQRLQPPTGFEAHPQADRGRTSDGLPDGAVSEEVREGQRGALALGCAALACWSLAPVHDAPHQPRPQGCRHHFLAVATPLSMRRCWSGAWCLWLVAAMLTGAARGGDALTVAVLGWRGCAGAGAELFRVGCSCLHQRSRLRSAAPVRLRMDGGREGRRRRRDEDEVQGRRRAIDAENTLGSRGYKEWLLLTVAIGFIACALLVRTLVSADRACKCIWTRRLRVIKGAREEARKRGRGKGGTRSIERRCRHVHRRGRVYR